MTGKSLDVRLRVRRARMDELVLDVDIHVAPGVTVVFGPSGAGKSTLLLSIAGIVTPAEGRISIGEEVWFDSSRHINVPVHRRTISLVFQALSLFPHLTAVENVAYGIERSFPREARRKRAMDMLERMKVAHLATRRPRTLSGGEAQRVALARAFARAPRAVLLDEAFSALDRELRLELCQDVRAQVTAMQIPAILVTHHRMEARAMGDRALLLRQGRIERVCGMREFLDEVATEEESSSPPILEGGQKR